MMKKNRGKTSTINREMGATLLYRLLFVVLWSQNTTMLFVAQIFRRIPVFGQFYNRFTLVVIGCLFILTFGRMVKRIRAFDLMFILGYVVMILLTMVLFPNNVEHINSKLSVILTAALPMYFFGVCYEHETLKEDLFIASVLGIILSFLYMLFFLSTREMEAGSDMSVAYNVLPNAMYIVYWAFEKRKLSYWVLVAFSFFYLIACGTRGAVLAFILYFFLSFFFVVMREKKPIKILLCLILGLLIVAFISSEMFLDIIRRVSQFLGERGFSTRILNKILEDEIADDSGRSVIYSKIKEAIEGNSIFGLGFMGDRAVLNGAYAHNLFLEILCSFGIPLGILVIFMLSGFCIVGLVRTKKKSEFPLYLLLVVLVYTKLMFSGSYAIEPYFYFMIGIGISLLRKYERKRMKNEINKELR